jgi:outer membrane biosynthesis protein TonB
MRKALLYSFIFHICLMLAVYFDMHFSFFKKIDTTPTMLIDFVAIGDKSAAPKKAPAPAPDEVAKEEGPKEDLKKQPEPLPEKPKESEKPKDTPKDKPKDKDKPKEAEKPKDDSIPLKKDKDKPKKEEKKPEEPKKPEPKKSKKAEVDLTKPKPKGTKDDAKDKKPKAKKKSMDDILSGVTKDETDAIDELMNDDGADVDELAPVVTASEIDAVRRKIHPCWSVPSGAKGAKDLVVDLEMELSPDGTVIKADVVDKGRMKSDPYFNVAAESARRAVLDPKCNPLPLPKDKYDKWKNMEMSFNPKDMF